MIKLSMSKMSGNLSENAFCSEILKQKFRYEEMQSEIDGLQDLEIKNLINANVTLVLLYYNSFFNNYFDSDKKSSIICDFSVSWFKFMQNLSIIYRKF